MPSLSGSLVLLGSGSRSEGCSCLLGMGWPSALGVGVWPFLLEVGLLALPSRGWGWPVILRVGVGPVFLAWVLALPSNWCFLLEMVSWHFFLGVGFFLQRWLALPSCPSFFLSVVVTVPSWNGGWPFAMKVGPAVWGWKLASFSAFPSRGRGFALPSGSGTKPKSHEEECHEKS